MVQTHQQILAHLYDAGAASYELRTGAGTLGWRFARLPSDAQQAVRRRALRRISALPEGTFVDESQVLLTTARRVR